MIGLHGPLGTLLAIVVLVPLLGSGGAGPAGQIAARQLVVDRAEAAERALADLERSVRPGLEAARRGAAGVVSGAQPPGDDLETASELLADAVPSADRAAEAVRALEGARRLLDDPGERVTLGANGAELASIAGQIGATAPAADRFVAMRQRADRLLTSLDETLTALDRGDVVAARDAIEVARADHAELRAWDVGVVTLPVWLDATEALLDATAQLVTAVEDGDRTEAEAAAAEVERLGAEAASADRALRIAIGEGGSAVTAAPLSRLADLLREVADTRLEVAAILQSVGR